MSRETKEKKRSKTRRDEPVPIERSASSPAHVRHHSEEALRCLLEVTRDLNAADDLTAGLDRVAERLREYVPYESLGVLLLDDLGHELYFAHAVGFPDSVVAHWRFGMGQGIVGTAASTRQVVHVTDVDDDPRYINATPEVRSEIALPLVAGGRTIGVLDVGGADEESFSSDQQQLLTFLADNLAAAIENARIVANMREQAQTLSLLNELSREFSSILDRQALLERVAERVGRLIQYDLFCLMLWNEEAQKLEPALEVYADGSAPGRAESFEMGRGICGTAAALRQAVRVPNVHLDPRYVSCVRDIEVASELAVPLVFKDRLLGVIDLESSRYDAFSARHQQLLSTLASSLAIALENARLYEKLQSEERKLNDDLTMARRVQRQLLPRVTPWVRGLQLAFGYEPARHLGGDFFDFLPYGNDRVAVAVGDVSGKSTSAALYGALAVGILREYAVNRHRGPSRTLADLNRKLGRLEFDNRYLAMAFAVYDASSHALRLGNAGLPYPYLLRGRSFERLEVGGVPLGLLPEREYSETEITLEPGDSLVFVSDGVEDTRNSAGHEFGRERLEGTLQRLAGGSAREIAQGLIEATRLFAGGADAYDDRTVVVVKAQS
jgi:sigma-B regulation protein RsbU (phosphoserine phosphatase)